jgi:PKD repeat protein
VARTSGAAIRADYTHNAIFRDLYISDTTYGISFFAPGEYPQAGQAFYNGIYLKNQDQCHVSKIVAQCSNYSVYVDGSGYGNLDFSYDGYIENCDFYGVPGATAVGTGIYAGPNCGGLLIDYVSMNQLEYGVYAIYTGGQGGGIITIRGGYVENSDGHGYYILGYQNTVVEQLWGSLFVNSGNLTVTGVPNGSIEFNGDGTALIYGSPNSITGTGTYTVIDHIGGGDANNYIPLTTNQTLTPNCKFSADTSTSSLTATLPADPAVGDEIELFDVAGTWNTNNFIVANNTKLIEGDNDNLLCNVKYGLIKLIYTGYESAGWRIVPLPKHDVPVLLLVPTPVISAASFSGTIPFTINLLGTIIPQVPVTNWYWNLTGGNSAQFTTQNVTYTYTTSGTYTVNLTASNASGFGTATRAITATPPPLTVDPYSDYVTLLLHFNP